MDNVANGRSYLTSQCIFKNIQGRVKYKNYIGKFKIKQKSIIFVTVK